MTTHSSSRLGEPSRAPVPLLDAGARYWELKDEYDAAYRRVMESGRYVLGQELEAFEAEFATFCGASYAVGVANGLEALSLILRAMGIGAGDEVLAPANTFIATWLAVSHTGARPVPVEPVPETFNLDPDRIDRAVTERTRAVIVVHLYGQPAMMDAIAEVAARRGLRLIEDAAQAHGARYKGRPVGALADAGAFSFYPAKNLGAFGDGGAVVSNDRKLIERVRLLRNYGSKEKYRHELCGFNSRLDPLQAAFLRVELAHLEEWNSRRADVAQAYLRGLAGIGRWTLPAVPPWAGPVWHLFVIRHPDRDRLRARLASMRIETGLHYPAPPHLSKAYADLGMRRGDLPITELMADTVLSLPIGPHLGIGAAEQVIRAMINAEAAGG